MELLRSISKSFIGRTVAFATTPQLQLFSVTLIYYFSLYFSTSNRTLLLLTLLYWLLVFLITRDFKLSLFIGLIATLLFPKGRAYQLLILPKESIDRWAIVDIIYFFPVYLVDIFLGLLAYLYLRKKMVIHYSKKMFKKFNSFWWLSLFIGWVILSGSFSVIPAVSLLSAAQLLRMLWLLVLPSLMFNDQKNQITHAVLIVAIAVLLFQSGWVINQRIAGGPLGKDIEVYLPGKQFGILASENTDLLRTTGTFFEPSILGTFLLMQMVILLPLVFKKPQSKHFFNTHPLGWLALGLGSLALVFTGSRILYGVWLVLAGFSWWFWRHNKVKLNLKNSTKLIAIVLIPVIIITGILIPYLAHRIETLADVFSQYGSANYRLAMMQYSTRLAIDNLWHGVGINLSPYYFATEFAGEQLIFDPTYPHNLFFQLLAETGLVGILIFIALVHDIIKPFFQYLNRGIIKKYSLAAGVYLLCAMFYPIFLNHPEISSYFFLYAGLVSFDQGET